MNRVSLHQQAAQDKRLVRESKNWMNDSAFETGWCLGGAEPVVGLRRIGLEFSSAQAGFSLVVVLVGRKNDGAQAVPKTFAPLRFVR